MLPQSTSFVDNKYCKVGDFRENIFFANSVKPHILDVETRDKMLISPYKQTTE